MQTFPLPHSNSDKVISPFAGRQTHVQDKEGKWRLIVVVGLAIALALMGTLLVVAIHRLGDSYRAMEEFPVERYFENYQTLAGSKYRAELRVEADLGWKDNAGRLMLFSSGEDPRPFGILIPVSVANGITFVKGQDYTAEVQVKEGGLIYADSFRKN